MTVRRDSSIGFVLAACYWEPSVNLRAEFRKARGLSDLVELLRVAESDGVVNAAAIALRNLAIDLKNRDVLGGWAIKELVAVLPDPSEQTASRRRHSDETLTSVLAALNEIIRTNDTNAKILFEEGGVAKMLGIMNAKGHFYNAKVMKYTAHVLNTMYKHRTLHELYKQHGYKESDFLHHRLLNSKSNASSPQSTLHRPRGDMGQPSDFTSKGKQITRPQRNDEYRMQKLTQSMDNLNRPYANGGVSSLFWSSSYRTLSSPFSLIQHRRTVILMQISMQQSIRIVHNKFNRPLGIN